MNRYTIEELDTFSDYEMLFAIVKDRTESTTNAYSPLCKRLCILLGKLERPETCALTKPKKGTFLYPGMLAQIKEMNKR